MYERFGVSEYWVIDLELDTITVYRRVLDAFVRVAEPSAEHADMLTTPLLPGFLVMLAEVFESPFPA